VPSPPSCSTDRRRRTRSDEGRRSRLPETAGCEAA
jgi:hypothetical protein